MENKKNELSQEDLAKVNGGGYGNRNYGYEDNGISYTPDYPFYLMLSDLLNSHCNGFEGDGGFTGDSCLTCKHRMNYICTIRTRDKDPYAKSQNPSG